MSIDDTSLDKPDEYTLGETLERTLRAFAYNHRHAEEESIRQGAYGHALRFMEELSDGMDPVQRQRFTKAYLLYFNKAISGTDEEYPRPEDESTKS